MPTVGDVIAGRFVLERFAARGGMGMVFRALDRQTAKPVALKVLDGEDEEGRFVEEAEVLQDLKHAAIVGHIAHGVLPQGAPWLAMDWLEGEDLGTRLERGPLPVAAALTVVRRACEGLEVAHRRGVIHRDLKPSNVFLVDGREELATVLDFGVARSGRALRPRTRTGALVGTVGYMAPEQALGSRAIDSSIDVFAMGCLLFEALTGLHAFSGDTALAVLASVTRGDTPSLAKVAPDLPSSLDALLARMLAREPTDRFRDATEVLGALDALTLPPGLAVTLAPPRRALTSSEQRLVTLIVVELASVAVDSTTLPIDEVDRVTASTRDIVLGFGGQVSVLGGGFLIATIARGESASDYVRLAASCARAIVDSSGDSRSRVALVTTRVTSAMSAPGGSAIGQATALLRLAKDARIVLDLTCARLVDEWFDLIPTAAPSVLELGPRRHGASERRLLGRPSPCVGRDKELRILEATLAECESESLARGVLVTAGAGVGKSRLRRAFVARIEGRARVLAASGNPLGASNPLDLARQLVLASVPDGQSSSLRSHLADKGFSGPANRDRVGDFLARLVGAPPRDEVCPELLAARSDARAMQLGVERAFLDWLRAEAAAQPLALVVEDLQWADPSSLALLVSALGIDDAPIGIFLFGRPEASASFPRLVRAVHEVRLLGLARRPAAQIVRSALGEHVEESLVARLVDLAAGNAFYLEELVRRVHDRGGEGLPETVIAMAEARVLALDSDARRVLRAASLFGDRIVSEGAAAIAGTDVSAQLEALVESEVLERRREGGYSFRHGLLREAAYATIPEADRIEGHRVAAEWLATQPSADALAIVSHFERAELLDRTSPWLDVASAAALEAGDLEAAHSLSVLGLSRGARGAARGRMLVTQLSVVSYRGDAVQASRLAAEALALLEPGTGPWFAALSGAVFSSLTTGEAAPVGDVFSAMHALDRAAELAGPPVSAILLGTLLHLGQREPATRILAGLEKAERAACGADDGYTGWCRLGRALYALYTCNIGEAWSLACSAASAFARGDNGLGRGIVPVYQVLILSELGRFEEARAMANHALQVTAGLPTPRNWVTPFLGRADLNAGHVEVARELVTAGLDCAEIVTAAVCRAVLAECLLALHDMQGARREALLAREISFALNIPRANAEGVLGRALMLDGETALALEVAESALERASGVLLASDRAWLLAVRAQATAALGRDASVEAAEASRLSEELVAQLEPEHREALRAHPAHAAALGLAPISISKIKAG
jgi:predicted Ser/Thr protein kinase